MENIKLKIPIKDVYKIHIYDENANIKDIYIFSSGIKIPLEQLFSDDEIEMVESSQIKIHYDSQILHLDDSIITIKTKIQIAIKGDKERQGVITDSSLSGRQIPIESIYMFSNIHYDVDVIELYQQITKNEKRELSKELFGQLLNNLTIPPSIIDNIKVKDEYSFEDILGIMDSSSNTNTILKIPIGQMFMNHKEYTFSANPFLIMNTTFSQFELSEKNPLLSFENHLLLNYTSIHLNNIYVCLAEDVFKYSFKHNIDETYISKLYFPFLYKLNIHNSVSLQEHYQELISKPRTDTFTSSQNSVDMFYHIYHMRTEEHDYISRGITSFSINLRNIKTESKKLPLEVIFKNIHATSWMPWIIYNPGQRKENIIRVFSTQFSKNGTRIPFLPETTINRISRSMGKGNTISMYIIYSNPENIQKRNIELFVELDSRGKINIKTDNYASLSYQKWNYILKFALNPMIREINNFLNQSGYSLPLFIDLNNNSNVEFENMKYNANIRINKSFSLLENIPCITQLFDVVNGSILKGEEISMRFKRVELYQKMDAQNLLITQILQHTQNYQEVIEQLMKNDNKLTHESALLLLYNYNSEQKQVHGKIILQKPGFPVTMKYHYMDKSLHITMQEIVNIQYLEVMETYIDSILRITQRPETTTYPLSSQMSIICKKYKEDIINSQILVVGPPITDVLPIVSDQIRIYGENIEDEDEDEDDNDEFGYFEFEENEEDVNEEDVNEEDVNEEDEMEGGNNHKNKSGGSDLSDMGLPENFKLSQYFLNRLKLREPKLFLQNKQGKFDAYSTICQANHKRQPIILTNEEKQDIDNKHPGSYSHAVQYGTDSKKPFWYICPRYWCLKTNTSLTEAEVKSGVCGGIIPKDATTVPKGHYVYEFNHEKQHRDAKGNYVESIPGFNTEGHPDGYCLPCCFKSDWNRKFHQTRRNQCSIKTNEGDGDGDGDEDEDEDEEIIPKKNKKTAIDKTHKDKNISYVMTPAYYPLPAKRWGYLPRSVELLLNMNTSEAISKTNPALIQPNKPCLLRYGIENSNNQSFMGILCELYAYKHNLPKPPTIQEFRGILEKAITIDHFIKYHHGSLPSSFKYSKTTDPETSVDDIDYTKYSNSIFYQNSKNEKELDFLEETILAYENFMKYLHDSYTIIDHSYLWDITVDDNPLLMIGGFNLVILEIANNDITDNIEILCPTNSIMEIYDPKKETVIILKHEMFYEPIYLYENRPPTIHVIRSFQESSPIKSVIQTLQLINRVSKQYCSPQPSLPHIYKFRLNIPLGEMIVHLNNSRYNIHYQVLNYQPKVIGLFISPPGGDETRGSFFVPCLPSPVSQELKTIYMDNNILWNNDYNTTIKRLKQLKKKTDGEIYCEPKLKIIEDKLVVGILTETNQFIQLSRPELPENTGTELESIDHSNYLIPEKILTTSKKRDSDRERTIRKISIESQFYQVFRTQIRILMNKYENRRIRQHILDSITETGLTYKQKLLSITKDLKQFSNDGVSFQDMSLEIAMSFGEITGCYDGKKKPYCLIRDESSDTIPQLIIPKLNLISGFDNETLYFGRLADEFVRYHRIRIFMFQPKNYLNIQTNMKYSIHNDEFLSMQSMLSSDSFQEPFNTSSFIHNTNYNTANPKTSQHYSNEISINEQNQIMTKKVEPIIVASTPLISNIINQPSDEDKIYKKLEKCIGQIRDVIGSSHNSIWKRNFPNDAKEIIFKKSPQCSFTPFQYIIQPILSRYVPLSEIKTTLYGGYMKLQESYQQRILVVLANQGKKTMMKSIKNIEDLELLIQKEDYYMTDIDAWILAREYSIPIILFSSTQLKNMVAAKWLYMGSSTNSLYSPIYFLRSPPNTASNETPEYSIVAKPYKYSELKDLTIIIQSAIDGSEEYTQNIQTLEEFLDGLELIT